MSTAKKKLVLTKRRFDVPKKEETKIVENTIRSNFITQLRSHINDEDIITAYEKEIFQISQKEYKKPADFTSSDFLNIYTHHAIFLLQNLDKDSYIRSNVTVPTTHDQISIDPSKLKPEKWKPYEEHMAKIADEIMNATEETTDVYQCGKCKQRQCIYYISQTRSADEGFTITIKCKTKGCNNSWRDYS